MDEIMYADKQLMLSEGQNLVSGASENVLDSGKKGDAYDALWLVVATDKALAVGQTLKVEVQTATDSAFTTPVSLAIYQGKVGQSQVVKERFPREALQYVRLVYTPGVGVTGKVTSGLYLDVDTK